MSANENIRQILQRLPDKPGVYRYYDTEGNLLYVGKAKSLKKRVASYFNKNKYENGKTRLLVRKIADIKFIVVDTEFDALLLENNLIKEHQPKYNIQLKDDKTYPWLVIRKERFPRVHPTRRMIKDGSEYYGPYASVKTMHAMLDLIKRLHPLRTCNYLLSEENVAAGKFRACLEFHLGNCKAPCVDRFSEDEYNANIDAIREIIKGNYAGLSRQLRQRMSEHAAALEFEAAAAIKSRLEVLERYQVSSAVVSQRINDTEVFSIYSDSKGAFVNYLKVMNGAIVQSYTTELRKRLDETDEELLAFAVVSLRDRFSSTSREVLLSHPVDFALPEVNVHVPQRGDKLKLIELSLRNATYALRDRLKQQEMTDPEAHTRRILETLQSDLHLSGLPVHIECFDNSNIQGTNPASACVVFKNAKPSKDDYRKFNIKTVEGPNDFASMTEVVYRRYKRLVDEGLPLPQLVIIDGGKGQLSAALKALEELGLVGKLAIVGIAKRLEEIYFPGDSIPIYIDKRSPSLKLIQQLRNEAHRFSLSHHRDRRSKAALKSSLTDVAGIGVKTAQKLLAHFGSVAALRKADYVEVEKVGGKKVAMALREAGMV
ncbi:MAG: excinuclease ABC subunit UvrC [Flavobacteriales bacterium]